MVTDGGLGSISIEGFAFEISAGADFSGAVDPFDVDNGFTLYKMVPAGITLTSGQSLGLGDVLFTGTLAVAAPTI